MEKLSDATLAELKREGLTAVRTDRMRTLTMRHTIDLPHVLRLGIKEAEKLVADEMARNVGQSLRDARAFVVGYEPKQRCEERAEYLAYLTVIMPLDTPRKPAEIAA